MKKMFLFIVANILFGQSLFAYDFAKVAPSGQTLYYNILPGSGNTVSVTGNPNGVSGNLTIPETVTHNSVTYTIVKIDEDAFRSCGYLTSVIMPNTVTEIGSYAFANCVSLSSVEIGNSVRTIGIGTFCRCSSLTTVYIPSSVQNVSWGVFSGCNQLTSIAVDGSNPWLDSRNNCNAIINTSSNTLISGCKNTIIPNTVLVIGEKAFENCNGLDSIIIPNSVTRIEDLAFYRCVSLNSIEIPNSVTFIGEQAFYNCSGLTSLTIGGSVETIEAYAFSDCYRLLSVGIPNTVSTIGSRAFYRVRNVNYHGPSVGDPWGALTLNGYVDGKFTYKDSIKTFLTGYVGSDSSIIIPDAVKRIGHLAFSDCNELQSITIPDSVTWIGGSLFDNCSNLKIFNYDAIECDTIGSVFGSNCNDSITFIVGKKVKTIPPMECGDVVSAVIINADSCIRMGTPSKPLFFHQQRRLSKIEFGSNVKYIPDYAFMRTMADIDSLIIPDSVEAIGDYSLSCYGPRIIQIGFSVNDIKQGAFSDCRTLSTLISKAEIPPTISDRYVFMDVSNILAIVPCGTASSYRQAWSYYISRFREIREDCGDGGGEEPGTEGIDDVDGSDIHIYTEGGNIVINGIENEKVQVFDMVGRPVGTQSLPTGVYMVKVGTLPARKVVVIR